MPSVYHDRKMLKWLPFEALEAQRGMLGTLYDSLEKETKPVLSDDQYAAMQYALEEALMHQSTIHVEYFSRGKRHHIEGTVMNVDGHQRILFLETATILLDDVLNIELL